MRAAPTVCYVFAAAISVGSAACVTQSAEPPDPGRAVAASSTPPPRRPLVIAVVGDNSGSTAKALVPRPTRAQIAELLDLVAAHGGDFGWTAVCTDSRQPMLRAHFEAPPVQRPAPALPLNPLLREEVLQEAEEAGREDAEALRDWDVRTREHVDSFLSMVADQLEVERSCRRSDVWGALQRAALLLGEPWDSSAVSGAPLRVLLVASDGEDNVRRPHVTLPGDVTTVIVNGSGRYGQLATLAPVAFEALAPSIRYIAHLAMQEKE